MLCEVIPENDERSHHRGDRCPCRPVRCVQTGLLTHNAFDLREVYEQATGEGMPGKGWAVRETPEPVRR